MILEREIFKKLKMIKNTIKLFLPVINQHRCLKYNLLVV